jgi:predicted lipid-binding transport protein (Tim44 family)
VELIAMVVSTLLVLRGVSRLRRSRLEAYRDFRRSLVVTITIGYVFAFYDDQLGALAGLLGNLILFAGIQLLIGLEHRLLEARGAGAPGTGSPPTKEAPLPPAPGSPVL